MGLFLKNLVFTVLVPGTVAVLLPYWMIARSGQTLTVDPARLLLAGPPMLRGATIYFGCLWDFAVTGRGTPAPIDPPKYLVVRGLYRYVRNPMYVSKAYDAYRRTVPRWVPGSTGAKPYA